MTDERRAPSAELALLLRFGTVIPGMRGRGLTEVDTPVPRLFLAEHDAQAGSESLPREMVVLEPSRVWTGGGELLLFASVSCIVYLMIVLLSLRGCGYSAAERAASPF